MSIFKIDRVVQTQTLSVSAGQEFDVTVNVPTGAQVLGGGWKVEDSAAPTVGYTFHPFENRPLSDGSGWFLRGLWGNTTSTLEVTLFVTYAQLA